MDSARTRTGALGGLLAAVWLLVCTPAALAGWTPSGAMTPPVAPNTSPEGFAFGNGNATVNFAAAADDQLHDLFWDPNAGWSVTGALTTTGVAAGTVASGFDLGGGPARTYYVGAGDGAIRGLDYDPGLGFNTTAGLTSAVAPGTSPSAFTLGKDAIRIYWVAATDQEYFVEAADGAVHELSYTAGPGFVVSPVLTEPVATGTSLAGFAVGGGIRVYFVARADNELHQLADTSSTGWTEGAAMSAPVASGTSPTAFAWGGACGQRVFFVAAADSTLHELAYDGPTEAPCASEVVATAPGAPAGTAPATIAPPARPGHVHVKFTLKWHWLGVHTTLQKVTFFRLPRSASIAVSCSGRGCPKRTWSSRPRRSRRLVSALQGRVFRAGDRLRITIAVPDEIVEHAEVRIRTNRKPVSRML